MLISIFLFIVSSPKCTKSSKSNIIMTISMALFTIHIVSKQFQRKCLFKCSGSIRLSARDNGVKL